MSTGLDVETILQVAATLREIRRQAVQLKGDGMAKLERIVWVAGDTYRGEAIYPTVIDKLAKIAQRIGEEEPFTRCNGLIAMLYLAYVLDKNGYVFDGVEDMTDLAEQLAVRWCSYERLRHILLVNTILVAAE